MTIRIIVIIVGSIPDFDDIQETTDTFWKETTYNKLKDGSDGGPKVMVYKDQDSAFIRCHDFKSNTEYIHILQHDETISNGIYRVRYADGDNGIGSMYFRRSGREEERLYRLSRYNDNGDIYYYDQICGKDGRWKYLAKYSLYPKTLEWTQHKVE